MNRNPVAMLVGAYLLCAAILLFAAHESTGTKVFVWCDATGAYIQAYPAIGETCPSDCGNAESEVER